MHPRTYCTGSSIDESMALGQQQEAEELELQRCIFAANKRVRRCWRRHSVMLSGATATERAQHVSVVMLLQPSWPWNSRMFVGSVGGYASSYPAPPGDRRVVALVQILVLVSFMMMLWSDHKCLNFKL